MTFQPTSQPTPAVAPASGDEVVVLLDEAGAAIGTAGKGGIHTANTPLHLAFSLYAFDADDRLLLTRRAAGKTFPLLWTNTVCGHPAPGEALVAAATRRARDELGLGADAVRGVRLVLPRFRYRAELDGVVENEMCPVLVCRVAGVPRPVPDEVAAVAWAPWVDVVGSALGGGRAGRAVPPLSPWAREQVALLHALGPAPDDWPTADPGGLPPAARTGPGLAGTT